MQQLLTLARYFLQKTITYSVIHIIGYGRDVLRKEHSYPVLYVKVLLRNKVGRIRLIYKEIAFAGLTFL